jgi:hypothetical protein
MEFRCDLATPATQPTWTYSHTRFGPRLPLVEPKPRFLQRVLRRLMRVS